MDTRLVEVLLVEDNPGDAGLIREALRDASLVRFRLTVVERMAEAEERLRGGGHDIVLLDLSLPDSSGFDTFRRARTEAPQIPIVVMTGTDDEAVAVRCVEEGAQDYLVKGRVDDALLARALTYALERHRLQSELRGLAVVDPVTGLYNARGFFMVAQQVLRLAPRLGKAFGLGWLTLRGFGDVLRAGGAGETEMLLMEIAESLRRAFDESAVLGRMGEGQFAVLALEEPPGSVGPALERVRAALARRAEDSGGAPLRPAAGIVPVTTSNALEGLSRAIEAAAGSGEG
jgi:PleD family two-component response regulator